MRSMRSHILTFVLAFGAVIAARAQTQRVRIRLGDRVVYVNTAAGNLPDLLSQEGLAPLPTELPGMPSPSSAGSPPANLPPASPGAQPPLSAAADIPANTVDLSDLTAESGVPDPGPMTDAFRQRMGDIYALTDPAELEMVWFWYGLESAEAAFGSRVGNAVHRYLVAKRDPDDPTRRVMNENRDPPYGEGFQGDLISVNGVTVRTESFGESVGTLTPGESVTILARGENNWYRVRGASGLQGWSSGFWLRF